MAEILLVHGSGFGAWCWRDLIPELARRGHSARAIDLPRTPGTTLGDQARAICAALRAPSLLIGHSAGGFPITAAPELDPRLIRALVWLAAYIPRDGSSVASLRRSQSDQPLRPALRIDRDAGSYRFAPDQLEPLFFHDCPPGTTDLSRAHMQPELIAPQEEALRLTANSQSLPGFAVTCSEDRAIPPAFQRQMAGHLPEVNRFTLATGHAPFFAAPALLAALPDQIARRLEG